MSGKPERLALRIIDFSCVSCAHVIRKELVKRGGIKEVKTNPILNEVYIYYEPGRIAPAEIEEVVRRSGYKAVRAQGMH